MAFMIVTKRFRKLILDASGIFANFCREENLDKNK